MEMLERFKDETILISLRDEAAVNLTEEVKQSLKSYGSKMIESLGNRGSYVVVINDGRVVSESLNNIVKAETEDEISDIEVLIGSSGLNLGNRSTISIGGLNPSPNRRGFNVLVISDKKFFGRYNYDFNKYPHTKSEEL